MLSSDLIASCKITSGFPETLLSGQFALPPSSPPHGAIKKCHMTNNILHIFHFGEAEDWNVLSCQYR